jgi:hypothetical protein
MTNCKNCNKPTSENYCANCGQQVQLKRINSHYISHELFHMFHLEKGFLYNVKELFLRPANSIREFILFDRNKHMKPIAFLVFCGIIYGFIHNYYKPEIPLNTEESYFKGSTVDALQHWQEKHFAYTYIIRSFFIAFWIQLFFRKYSYNFFEIMTLMCFAFGQGMLIVGMLLPFHSLLHQTANNILLISTTVLYPVIVVAQFFDKTKIINYLKAILTYFLGGITLFFVTVLIGMTVDLIIKLF